MFLIGYGAVAGFNVGDEERKRNLKKRPHAVRDVTG
jgi:hypothetical protein